MTGGRGERPEPVGKPGPGPEPVQEPGLPAALREALAGAPFVADALTTLDLAVDALLDARYAALSAEQVAASVRGLQRALARVDAARLRAVKAVDDRDDVVPGARRDAGASFLRCTLGLDSGDAHRDASAARLLDADTGDLGRLGAAYAAGLIHRGHVDVGVRVHRRLGPEVRARVDGETGQVCIDAVDEVLAAQAQRVSVSVLDRFGRELVDRLNPASPEGAHDRRYLHLGMLPDGSMIGKFACGPVQALALQAAISAGARPRPGRAIDADGVAHDLPDLRSPAQRRMDALADAVAAGLARAGIHLPTSNAPGDARGDGDGGATRGGDHGDGVTTDTGHDDGSTAQPSQEEETAGPQDEEPAASATGWDEPPPAEGEERVLREPGVLSGPYPSVEILITATLDQLAAAMAACGHGHLGLQRPLGADPRPPDAPPDSPPGEPPRSGIPPGSPFAAFDVFGAGAGLASAQHGGPVHPETLALLACSGALRRVLLAASGAVLDVGRAARLATPAQRRALTARDGGCTIPGCPVPAALCEAHHVVPWAAGGLTDLPNLCLLCSRHHTEADNGTWEIAMINGVPWVRPPAWIHRDRPLLRGAHGAAAAGP